MQLAAVSSHVTGISLNLAIGWSCNAPPHAHCHLFLSLLAAEVKQAAGGNATAGGDNGGGDGGNFAGGNGDGAGGLGAGLNEMAAMLAGLGGGGGGLGGEPTVCHFSFVCPGAVTCDGSRQETGNV